MLLQVIGTCKVLQIRGVDRDLSCGSLGGEAIGKVLEWKQLELERLSSLDLSRGGLTPTHDGYRIHRFRGQSI